MKKPFLTTRTLAAGTKSQCDEYSKKEVLVCNPAGGVLVTAACEDSTVCSNGECRAAEPEVASEGCSNTYWLCIILVEVERAYLLDRNFSSLV